MFVYLFRVLRPTRQFFTQMETSPLLVEGCKVLTTEWPVSSEGSLTCYTYCYTGNPFIIVISEDQ